jgi:hypothetical protein
MSAEVEPRKGQAFSNSSEWECWSAHWCDVCRVDEPARDRGQYEKGCPLILQALSGFIPAEWLEQEFLANNRYAACVNFRGYDDGGDEPKHPERPMPGQGELIPREDFERPKVFADTANEIHKVDA